MMNPFKIRETNKLLKLEYSQKAEDNSRVFLGMVGFC